MRQKWQTPINKVHRISRRGHDISAEDNPHCDRILNSDNQEDEEDEEIVGVQQGREDLMESRMRSCKSLVMKESLSCGTTC